MKTGETTFEGKKYEYVYPDGLETDLPVQIREIFKEEVYKLGRRKKDAIYLDIGANIGNASRYFYPYAKTIYAIEPNPDIYKALVENTKDLPNIKTFNCAIAHTDGFDYLYSNEISPIAQSFWGGGGSLDAKKVETKSLDTFLTENNINHVDVMKIDVEGSEYVIFPSEAFRKAAEKIDFIIGEAHYNGGGGFPQIIPAMLKDCGFKTEFSKDKANYFRNFTFHDTSTNIKRSWAYPENTMFTATK